MGVKFIIRNSEYSMSVNNIRCDWSFFNSFLAWLVNGSAVFACFFLFMPITSQAGFLEMPDIKEVPTLERETLLKDVDIPGVKDRDPDPEAGVRLNVTEFRLQGVVEYPKLGITRADLIERVEKIRFDLMKEDKLTEDGYTEEELGELSDLLGDIEEDTKGEHVGPLEVQKLVFLIREQRRSRGVTLGMIETVADTITRYYREKGFILAKAYIPKQEVRDGVVTLTLLLGELGEVSVENNTQYSDSKVSSIFNDAIDEPVTNKMIEERLYLINDLPGMAAQGFFQPGSQVGDTKLSINVLNESRFNANLRLDNHGSIKTGEERLFLDVALNNPLGIADQLNVSLLKSAKKDGSTYGAFRYALPVFNPRLLASIDISTNEFTSEFTDSASGSTTFAGTSRVSDFSLLYKFKRSRTSNRSVEASIIEIATTTVFSGGDKVDNTQNIEFTYVFDRLIEEKRLLHAADITLLVSSFSVDSGFNDDKNVSEQVPVLQGNYSGLSFWKIPFSEKETRLLSHFSFQLAGRSVGSVNQFDMSGPTRARGFDVTRFFADDAIYAGVDWVFDSPKFMNWRLFGHRLDKAVQPFLLFDMAYGVTYPTFEDDLDSVRAQMANVGGGLKLNFGRSFGGSLVIAKPVMEEYTDEDDNKVYDNKGINIYFDLLYSF